MSIIRIDIGTIIANQSQDIMTTGVTAAAAIGARTTDTITAAIVGTRIEIDTDTITTAATDIAKKTGKNVKDAMEMTSLVHREVVTDSGTTIRTDHPIDQRATEITIEARTLRTNNQQQTSFQPLTRSNSPPQPSPTLPSTAPLSSGTIG